MIILMTTIVILFESLYYSFFMRSCRKQNNIIRYIISFVLIAIVGLIIGTNNLPSYLLLILMIVYSLKYIVKLKVSLYDMLVVFIMLLIKLLIETPIYAILIGIIDNFWVIIYAGIVKLAFVYLFRKELYTYYNKLKIKWDNNNFYIRYIFTTLMYIYVIASCIFLIVKLF